MPVRCTGWKPVPPDNTTFSCFTGEPRGSCATALKRSLQNAGCPLHCQDRGELGGQTYQTFYNLSVGQGPKRLSPTGKRLMFMKKLMVALICGLVLAPVSAWGQKWIEPYTDKDGAQVEGHWQTPEDLSKDRYSTPGTVNPYTGQFNPYTGGVQRPQSVTPTPGTPVPANPTLPNQNPYYPQKDYRYKGR